MKNKSIVINSQLFYNVFNNLFTGGNHKFIDDFLGCFEQDSKVIDIGCGDGYNLNYIAENVIPLGKQTWTGIDLSKNLIESAISKYPHLKFETGDVSCLPYDSNSFDIIVSSFLFHHLPSEIKKKGLLEIHRILKPGGHFFYIDYGKPNKWYSKIMMNCITRWFEHIHLQMNNEVIDMMANIGFFFEQISIKEVFNGSVYCIKTTKE